MLPDMNDGTISTPRPTISSLKELRVSLPDDVRSHLAHQYSRALHSKAGTHFERILDAMKMPPAVTVCRVNLIRSTRTEIINGLEEALESWREERRHKSISDGKEMTSKKEIIVDENESLIVRPHDIFDDIVLIDRTAVLTCSLSSHRIPRPSVLSGGQNGENGGNGELFPSWTERAEKGWPLKHRVVICDRLCGEAVLRGSDIFVRGMICADNGVKVGEDVAVYADLGGGAAVPRGQRLEKYTGHCVFLGVGTACCNRTDMFTLAQGLAVSMSADPNDRAGPILPPLNGVLVGKMMLQYLPSVLVGYALDARAGDVVLDMCCAPGGKTSHVASLIRDNGLIIACDKSRKKMTTARAFFDAMGASCIVPLALDSTKIVSRDEEREKKSVKELLSVAQPSKKDGLLNIKAFYPESFDRIILDPPCSALGLRPKLRVEAEGLNGLKKYVDYQHMFVREAVALLKVDGTMTYSTCTINAAENEEMVHHILERYPFMELVDIPYDVGSPGLPGTGLAETARNKVKRFEPSDNADTMGFFVAKFVKRRTFDKI